MADRKRKAENALDKAPSTGTAAAAAVSPPSAVNHNEKIIAVLAELERNERNIGERYKANAYHKAIQSIKQYPKAITSGREAKALPGIGDKIAKKIDEILSTGHLQKLDVQQADPKVAAINLISRVQGIGPVAAKKFVEEGVRTIDDLRKRAAELNTAQRIGLKYFEELDQRIPRAEIVRMERLIRAAANTVDPQLEVTICGSYRRGAATSGDIDVLITHPLYTSSSPEPPKPYLDLLVAELRRRRFITDTLSLGPKKYMGVCILPDHAAGSAGSVGSPAAAAADAVDAAPVHSPSKRLHRAASPATGASDPIEVSSGGSDGESGRPLHRRIDIRIFPIDEYPCALLYFTGSDMLNREMRMIAQERGFILNEYSLTPVGETGVKGQPLPVTCEKDIFDYLGMEYKPPEQRNV